MKYVITVILAAMLVSPGFGAPKKKPGPKKAWHEANGPKFAESDLGRVFCGSFVLDGGQTRQINKCMAIRLGDELGVGKEATILFDKELLCMAAAIPNRFAAFNTYRNGLGGAGHRVGAPYIFGRTEGPGWAQKDGFSDPRGKKYGALPGTR
jgi:hypothetical protein